MLGMSYERWLELWKRLDGENCSIPCPKCGCYTPDVEGKYGGVCKVCVRGKQH